MLSHTRMGVPYEYTRMGQYTHIGQNTYIIVRPLVTMYLLSSVVLIYQLFFKPFSIDETV